MLMRTPPSIIGLLKSWPGSAFSLIGRLGGVGCLTITKWGLLIVQNYESDILFDLNEIPSEEEEESVTNGYEDIPISPAIASHFASPILDFFLSLFEVKLGELEAELSVIKVIVKTLQWLSSINSSILSVLHMATLPKAFMKAILESFTRVLQGLAFNTVA
uniref:Uncharacterized protein n=1 Tax=Brassica campestris TaxID=3711 RepID=M4F1Q2_BRACM